MPDVAPPLQFANPAGNVPESALTPERIERVLADFRDWLSAAAPVETPAAASDGKVDLHTLVGQFTALRHEVNLQTKASRSSIEQNAATLQKFEEAMARLEEPVEEETEEHANDEALKPLLKAMIDVHDALALALRQVEKQRVSIHEGLKKLRESSVIEPPPTVSFTGSRRGFWKRLFGGDPATQALALADWHRRTAQAIAEREQQVRATCEYLEQALDGLLTGYAMSLSRIDRVLPQYGLEAMKSAGERFDPELMEVVEVITASGRPSGEVIDEIRRGYIWNDTIFRYAQVRVAK
ncbi:MAG: nucleotide exchange factor GrpE [Planctomycetes bacterium]|nr:nucleotide exchange factor GrpE [Planctomycetota bacterium]